MRRRSASSCHSTDLERLSHVRIPPGAAVVKELTIHRDHGDVKVTGSIDFELDAKSSHNLERTSTVVRRVCHHEHCHHDRCLIGSGRHLHHHHHHHDHNHASSTEHTHHAHMHQHNHHSHVANHEITRMTSMQSLHSNHHHHNHAHTQMVCTEGCQPVCHGHHHHNHAHTHTQVVCTEACQPVCNGHHHHHHHHGHAHHHGQSNQSGHTTQVVVTERSTGRENGRRASEGYHVVHRVTSREELDEETEELRDRLRNRRITPSIGHHSEVVKRKVTTTTDRYSRDSRDSSYEVDSPARKTSVSTTNRGQEMMSRLMRQWEHRKKLDDEAADRKERERIEHKRTEIIRIEKERVERERERLNRDRAERERRLREEEIERETIIMETTERERNERERKDREKAQREADLRRSRIREEEEDIRRQEEDLQKERDQIQRDKQKHEKRIREEREAIETERRKRIEDERRADQEERDRESRRQADEYRRIEEEMEREERRRQKEQRIRQEQKELERERKEIERLEREREELDRQKIELELENQRVKLKREKERIEKERQLIKESIRTTKTSRVVEEVDDDYPPYMPTKRRNYLKSYGPDGVEDDDYDNHSRPKVIKNHQSSTNDDRSPAAEYGGRNRPYIPRKPRDSRPPYESLQPSDDDDYPRQPKQSKNIHSSLLDTRPLSPEDGYRGPNRPLKNHQNHAYDSQHPSDEYQNYKKPINPLRKENNPTNESRSPAGELRIPRTRGPAFESFGRNTAPELESKKYARDASTGPMEEKKKVLKDAQVQIVPGRLPTKSQGFQFPEVDHREQQPTNIRKPVNGSDSQQVEMGTYAKPNQERSPKKVSPAEQRRIDDYTSANQYPNPERTSRLQPDQEAEDSDHNEQNRVYSNPADQNRRQTDEYDFRNRKPDTAARVTPDTEPREKGIPSQNQKKVKPVEQDRKYAEEYAAHDRNPQSSKIYQPNDDTEKIDQLESNTRPADRNQYSPNQRRYQPNDEIQKDSQYTEKSKPDDRNQYSPNSKKYQPNDELEEFDQFAQYKPGDRNKYSPNPYSPNPKRYQPNEELQSNGQFAEYTKPDDRDRNYPNQGNYQPYDDREEFDQFRITTKPAAQNRKGTQQPAQQDREVNDENTYLDRKPESKRKPQTAEGLVVNDNFEQDKSPVAQNRKGIKPDDQTRKDAYENAARDQRPHPLRAPQQTIQAKESTPSEQQIREAYKYGTQNPKYTPEGDGGLKKSKPATHNRLGSNPAEQNQSDNHDFTNPERRPVPNRKPQGNLDLQRGKIVDQKATPYAEEEDEDDDYIPIHKRSNLSDNKQPSSAGIRNPFADKTKQKNPKAPLPAFYQDSLANEKGSSYNRQRTGMNVQIPPAEEELGFEIRYDGDGKPYKVTLPNEEYRQTSPSQKYPPSLKYPPTQKIPPTQKYPNSPQKTKKPIEPNPLDNLYDSEDDEQKLPITVPTGKSANSKTENRSKPSKEIKLDDMDESEEYDKPPLIAATKKPQPSASQAATPKDAQRQGRQDKIPVSPLSDNSDVPNFSNNRPQPRLGPKGPQNADKFNQQVSPSNISDLKPKDVRYDSMSPQDTGREEQVQSRISNKVVSPKKNTEAAADSRRPLTLEEARIKRRESPEIVPKSATPTNDAKTLEEARLKRRESPEITPKSTTPTNDVKAPLKPAPFSKTPAAIPAKSIVEAEAEKREESTSKVQAPDKKKPLQEVKPKPVISSKVSNSKTSSSNQKPIGPSEIEISRVGSSLGRKESPTNQNRSKSPSNIQAAKKPVPSLKSPMSIGLKKNNSRTDVKIDSKNDANKPIPGKGGFAKSDATKIAPSPTSAQRAKPPTDQTIRTSEPPQQTKLPQAPNEEEDRDFIQPLSETRDFDRPPTRREPEENTPRGPLVADKKEESDGEDKTQVRRKPTIKGEVIYGSSHERSKPSISSNNINPGSTSRDRSPEKDRNPVNPESTSRDRTPGKDRNPVNPAQLTDLFNDEVDLVDWNKKIDSPPSKPGSPNRYSPPNKPSPQVKPSPSEIEGRIFDDDFGYDVDEYKHDLDNNKISPSQDSRIRGPSPKAGYKLPLGETPSFAESKKASPTSKQQQRSHTPKYEESDTDLRNNILMPVSPSKDQKQPVKQSIVPGKMIHVPSDDDDIGYDIADRVKKQLEQIHGPPAEDERDISQPARSSNGSRQQDTKSNKDNRSPGRSPGRSPRLNPPNEQTRNYDLPQNTLTANHKPRNTAEFGNPISPGGESDQALHPQEPGQPYPPSEKFKSFGHTPNNKTNAPSFSMRRQTLDSDQDIPDVKSYKPNRNSDMPKTNPQLAQAEDDDDLVNIPNPKDKGVPKQNLADDNDSRLHTESDDALFDLIDTKRNPGHTEDEDDLMKEFLPKKDSPKRAFNVPPSLDQKRNQSPPKNTMPQSPESRKEGTEYSNPSEGMGDSLRIVPAMTVEQLNERGDVIAKKNYEESTPKRNPAQKNKPLVPVEEFEDDIRVSQLTPQEEPRMSKKQEPRSEEKEEEQDSAWKRRTEDYQLRKDRLPPRRANTDELENELNKEMDRIQNQTQGNDEDFDLRPFVTNPKVSPTNAKKSETRIKEAKVKPGVPPRKITDLDRFHTDESDLIGSNSKQDPLSARRGLQASPRVSIPPAKDNRLASEGSEHDYFNNDKKPLPVPPTKQKAQGAELKKSQAPSIDKKSNKRQEPEAKINIGGGISFGKQLGRFEDSKPSSKSLRGKSIDHHEEHKPVNSKNPQLPASVARGKIQSKQPSADSEDLMNQHKIEGGSEAEHEDYINNDLSQGDKSHTGGVAHDNKHEHDDSFASKPSGNKGRGSATKVQHNKFVNQKKKGHDQAEDLVHGHEAIWETGDIEFTTSPRYHEQADHKKGQEASGGSKSLTRNRTDNDLRNEQPQQPLKKVGTEARITHRTDEHANLSKNKNVHPLKPLSKQNEEKVKNFHMDDYIHPPDSNQQHMKSPHFHNPPPRRIVPINPDDFRSSQKSQHNERESFEPPGEISDDDIDLRLEVKVPKPKPNPPHIHANTKGDKPDHTHSPEHSGPGDKQTTHYNQKPGYPRGPGHFGPGENQNTHHGQKPDYPRGPSQHGSGDNPTTNQGARYSMPPGNNPRQSSSLPPEEHTGHTVKFPEQTKPKTSLSGIMGSSKDKAQFTEPMKSRMPNDLAWADAKPPEIDNRDYYIHKHKPKNIYISDTDRTKITPYIDNIKRSGKPMAPPSSIGNVFGE